MLSNTTVRLVLDNLIIAVSMLLVIIPVRIYSKLQTLFVGLALIGSILVPLALGALGHDGFVSIFNATSPVSYAGVIGKAHALGYTPHFSWVDTVLTLPGLSFFLVTNWPCVVGGELKSVKKSMTVGVVGAGLFAWLIFFVTAGLYYIVLGPDFAGSVGYLVQNSPSDAPFGGTNLLTSILQYMYGTSTPTGVAVTVLIAASLVAACFIVIAQSILLSTRHIFAWAFDSVIPSRFASVNERFGTPVFTTLALWVVSEIVLWITIFQSSAISVLTNAGLAEALGYGPALVAAMVFSRRRKALFDSSPSTTKIKVAGAHLITILGAIGSIGFAAIVVFVAAYPQIGFPITAINIAFLIAVFVLGGIAYYAAKTYRKGHGIDIALAFQQIPPE
jgi:amino acid transporter